MKLGHFLGFSCALLALTGMASADLTVDPGGGGDHTTIQAAINAASPGETINVLAGTYNERLTITKSLTLLGAQAGVDPTAPGARTNQAAESIVTEAGLSTPNPDILIEIPSGITGVVIDGFTLNGDQTNTMADTCVVRSWGDTISIENNIIDGRFGLLFKQGDGLDVLANVITSSATGIVCQGGPISNVTISDNIFVPGTSPVADAKAMYLTSASTVVISSNAAAGFPWDALAGSNLTSVQVTGNAFAGQRKGVSFWGNTTFVDISGNTISGSLLNGIEIKGQDITIEGNAITGNDVGVYVDKHTLDTERVSISGNDLSGNTNEGLIVTAAVVETVDAAGNWWGDLDPSDDVVGNANYSPWLGAAPGTSPMTWYVGAGGSIQAAIDAADPGDTINVAAGTYDETLNIENKTDLSIIGDDAATTIIKSSSTIGWNVGGYGTNRQTVVRIVDSTGIVLQNLTIDCDLIKGNNRFGITGWDSSVSIDACVVQNMSAPDTSGYYAELGSYFKAPGYSDASRAAVSITNSTFMNAGRVGVVTHDYIDATIENNVFGKTLDDFGYGIEVGSMSTGVVRGNTFYGFDLPAASDGSESAGIYIENAFTASSPSVTKTVLVENNEIYGCQYGMWIGNGYNGYAGDVDIVVTLNNNNFHDNVEGGAWIQDEDASAGSSVSVSGGGNTWADNGDHGIRIYTAGDGDVSINLTGETISGNDTGVLVEDAAPAGSSYSVSITGSTITGNTSYGVNNTVSGLTVDASGNWWGSTDAAAVAAAASGDVDYSPWLGAAPGTTPMTWYVASIGTIQEAVDAAGAGDTVIVTPGTYVEQVNIGKDLTLQGSGSGTIVQAPAAMTPLFTTSSPHYPVLLAQGAVVAVKDLVVDGAGRGNGHSRFVGIAYRNAGGAVTNVEITDVRDTPFSGSQHGVAMYLYNNDGQSRSFALTGCDIHDFQKNAMALNADAVTPVDVTVQNCTITGYGATTTTAQNGIQVWGDVMTGLVDNNVVSGIAYDNTLNPTKWVATSILNFYADLDITNNEVSEGHLGVYNIDGAGQITGNTFSIEKVGVSAYGIVATDPPAAVPAPYGEESKAEGGVLENGAMLNVTIANNYLRLDGDDNTATYGIEADAGYGPDDLALTVQNNIVSGFDVGIELWQCESDCDTGTFTSILAQNNSLVGNTYGLRSNVTAINVDAEDNWWGDPLGPRPVGPGSGDAVSENADYDPWLGKPAQLNALYLQPTPTSFYIKTGETMVVHMNVANLQQNVNACQAMLGYSSTYFEDPSTGAVAAGGGGVWDQLIWDSWTDSSGIPGEIDTAIGVNAQGATGTNADGTVAIITLTAGTTEGVTRMIFREDLDPDPGLIKSTFLADINNGPVWPAKVDSTNVYIDGSDPTIGNLAATQNSTDVLDCAATTVQGTVNISVDASDALAGLQAEPEVTVTMDAEALTVAYVDENPAGTFNYTVEVLSTTPNGTWDIEATATDKSGNEASVTGTLCINKNAITGTVHIDSGSNATYSFDRNVVFTATNNGGTVLKTWTVLVSFSNAAQVAAGTYSLTNVPAGTSNLSAKTAWSLREKKAVTFDDDDQAVVDFTGADMMRGGDINGSNSVNILDYSTLKIHWVSQDPVADINGDLAINAVDYDLMKKYWFQVGDPQ